MPAPGQGECVEYAAGMVIYYAGHQAYGAYYLDHGVVRLCGRRCARTAHVGEVLGLKACLSGETHAETARCLDATRVYFMSVRELGSEQAGHGKAPCAQQR